MWICEGKPQELKSEIFEPRHDVKTSVASAAPVIAPGRFHWLTIPQADIQSYRVGGPVSGQSASSLRQRQCPLSVAAPKLVVSDREGDGGPAAGLDH